MKKIILLSAFLAVVLSGILPAKASGETPTELLQRIDDGFVQVFEKVAPSVVVVDVKKNAGYDNDSQGLDYFFRGPFDDDNAMRRLPLPNPSEQSEGSGFIVRPDGYIFTNNHVIAEASSIEVRLKDGRKFAAKVIGADDKTDVAVLKIDATNLTPVTFENSDSVRVGQLVCAIGIPFALDYSFTCGWVSAKGRSDLTRNQKQPTLYEDYIQTDAFINPGNSGGPLFDVGGKVIGMNTLINGIGRGLSFAISSNLLQKIGDQLIEKGRITRPWIGVQIQTLGENADLEDHLKGIEKGVIVQTITPDAPAYKSDLRPADVITGVDGVEVSEARELQEEILKKKIGQKVELTVWRNGQTLKMPVTTEEMPDNPSTASASPKKKPQEPEVKDEWYGLQLQDITPDLAKEMGLKISEGILVTNVKSNSPAAEAAIQRGDVITEADSKPVKDIKSLKKIFEQANPQKGLLLFIDRKGQKTYAVLKSEK